MRIKRIVTATDLGRKRTSNEDAVLEIREVPLLAIADGSGGVEPAAAALDALKQATPTLVERVAEIAREPTTSSRLALGRAFEVAFEEASRRVRASGEELRKRVATSLIAATLIDRYAFVAHVGNARAYMFRNNQLWPLTTDHTLAMSLFRRGKISVDEYHQSPVKKVLTQALGTTPHLQVEYGEVWTAPGDRLLLCSDGVTAALKDPAIADALSEGDIEQASRALIAKANAAGGSDNISVALVELDDPSRVAEPAEDVAETLRNVFLFSDMSEPDRRVVAPYLEEVHADAGHVICAEGAPGDSFYVIVSGKVRVTRGQVNLVEIGPGGHFGEIALVLGTGRTATVTAIERTRLFALSRGHFDAILREKPTVGTALAKPLVARMAVLLTKTTDRLVKIGQALHETDAI